MYGFSYVYNSGTDMGYLPEGAYYNTSSSTGDYYYLADSSGKKLTGEVKMGWKRYGLTVGGVDVHAKNYTNIKGLAISGTVSYSPSSKQLNLNNATIDIRKRLDWTECIVNYGENLTVNVTGTCTITRGNTSQGQDNRPTITSAKNLTFQGSGSLTIDNYQGYGILMGSGGQTLAFNKVENFKVNGYGIDMGQGTLSFNASSVKTYDVLNLGNLKMTDTEFENTKTIWDPNKKTIRYHYSNNRPSNISFKKVTTKYYVYIAGHMLNDVNANNFYYYNTSGTLTAEFMGTNNSILSITMEDFTADAEGKDNLIAEGGGCPAELLLITPNGNNELKNPNATAIYHYKSLWIGGYGTLTVDGEISTCQGAELHIANCTLHATRLAALDASSKLFVSDAHVLLSGKGDGTATISGFKSFSTVSSAVTTPAGAYYDESNEQLVDADGYRVTGEVEIQKVEYYDLKILGTSVSSLNCDNIPLDPALAGDYSGTVSFDPTTSILTIDNLTADYLTIIDQSDRDILNIKLNGQTKLKGDFTIQSGGIRTRSLPVVFIYGDTPDNNSSIKCDELICEASLIIYYCKVEGSRLTYEMPVATTQSAPQLLIQNSYVSLSGSTITTAYTLGGFNDFSMEEVTVVKPENWGYGTGVVSNVSDYCLYDGTGACNMAVEIRPDGWQAEGDVNGDGQVGIGDIVAITNVMAGIETDADIRARADVNGDGDVGIGDIVAITNIMAGK